MFQLYMYTNFSNLNEGEVFEYKDEMYTKLDDSSAIDSENCKIEFLQENPCVRIEKPNLNYI